jgi:hypothetical protein
MTNDTERWRPELAVWLAVDAAVIVAFWIGSGPVAALVSGAVSLAVTAIVHLGRRRVDAIGIVSAVGDERHRGLSTKANSATATLLWAVITPWWLVTVIRGDQNVTRLVLVVVHAIGFFVSSYYNSRRG